MFLFVIFSLAKNKERACLERRCILLFVFSVSVLELISKTNVNEKEIFDHVLMIKSGSEIEGIQIFI